MTCKLCGGPIGAGEPVCTFDNGVIHRFKKTCNDFNEARLRELKDKPPKDRPPRNRRLKVKKAGA